MGLMEPRINGTEADKAIASVLTNALNKPWYRKVESWLTIVNIVALILNIVLAILSFKQL